MTEKANRRGLVEKPDLGILGPIREIIRLVEEGKRSKQQLQAFVEGCNPFEGPTPLYIKDAIDILGADNVVTVSQACTAFDYFVPLGTGEAEIRYDAETLRECAEQNRHNQAKWRLIYILPLSLRRMREIIGTEKDCKTQPCFASLNWWLKDSEIMWSTSFPKEGYYLIDFNPRFMSTTWTDQKRLITSIGWKCQRADERVLTQALISIFRSHKSQRFLYSTSHWGKFNDSVGNHITVGKFTGDGIVIERHPDHIPDPDVYVCVERRPDF